MRFRKHKYVMSGDIAKMYRQVLIKPEQRNLQRIIWRENPYDKINHYKLNTVTYGTSSAPLIQIAIDNEISSPAISQIIKKDFYVDNLLTGSNSVDDLLIKQQEICNLISQAGFELRQWLSNSEEFLNQIQINKELSSGILNFGENEQTKTLGVFWNAKCDTIEYSTLSLNDNNIITKRKILSIISQIFDPLGLLGPIIVVAKILMQKLWQKRLSWDESVPQILYSTWINFQNSLIQLNDIKIPRCVLLSNPILVEIHGFSDASESAYGTCIYIRCQDQLGNITSNLLCAKSRVAPLKKITIPRLELCGALLMAQLYNKVLLSMDINITNYYLWCDSTIVLCCPPNKWKTFVSNRVSTIQNFTNKSNWFHVESQENPADKLSRGMKCDQIVNCEIWWHGPSWLTQSKNTWNLELPNTKINSKVLEQKSVKPNTQTYTTTNKEFDIFTKFSSFIKLQRVWAYCLRFISNLRCNKETRNLQNLTIGELQTSIDTLTRISQRESFPIDYEELQKNNSVPRKSKLLSLNTFIDDNNIIRVGGRLKQSSYSFNKKHPAVLDSKH